MQWGDKQQIQASCLVSLPAVSLLYTACLVSLPAVSLGPSCVSPTAAVPSPADPSIDDETEGFRTKNSTIKYHGARNIYYIQWW